MAHCELPSNACRNARICPEDTRQQPPIKEAPAVRIIFACVPCALNMIFENWSRLSAVITGFSDAVL